MKRHQLSLGFSYEARPTAWHPDRRKSASARSFSIGVGLAGSRAAAIYRVRGPVSRPHDVEHLAAALVDWLNDPDRVEKWPGELLAGTGGGVARIELTAAGRAAGFLPVGGEDWAVTCAEHGPSTAGSGQSVLQSPP